MTEVKVKQLTVTEKASEKIKELAVEQDKADSPLRLVAQPGCCGNLKYGLFFDEKASDDEVLEFHGVQVVLDPASKELSKGSVIDFVSTPEGEGFDIKNPSQPEQKEGQKEGGCCASDGGCGCGH